MSVEMITAGVRIVVRTLRGHSGALVIEASDSEKMERNVKVR